MSKLFAAKKWKNRKSEFPNRRVLENINTKEKITVDVTRAEGDVKDPGNGFDEVEMNDLEKRINSGFDETEKVLENQFHGISISYNKDDNHFYAEDPDGNIKKLGSGEGTAATSQVLSGATFTSAKYNDMETGTMPDYSASDKRAKKSEQTQTDEYLTIDEGYYKNGRIITSKSNAIHCYYIGSVNFRTTKTESKIYTLQVPQEFVDIGLTNDDFLIVPVTGNYSLRFLNQTHDSTQDYNWDHTVFYSNNYDISYNDGKLSISLSANQSENAGAQPTGTDWTFTAEVTLNVFVCLGGISNN